MIRLLNICVIVALVFAAAYVYKIKFESTRKAEQAAKLRLDIRREHRESPLEVAIVERLRPGLK